MINIPGSKIDFHPVLKNTSGYKKYVSGVGKINNDIKILLDTSKVVVVNEFRGINLVQ